MRAVSISEIAHADPSFFVNVKCTETWLPAANVPLAPVAPVTERIVSTTPGEVSERVNTVSVGAGSAGVPGAPSSPSLPLQLGKIRTQDRTAATDARPRNLDE